MGSSFSSCGVRMRSQALLLAKRAFSSSPTPPPATTSPLDGVKVLDMTRVLAGPFATMILSDLGAEVIKVERPGGGDDTRAWGPPFLEGKGGRESAYFLSVNRNKQSICVDMKSAKGNQILQHGRPPSCHRRPCRSTDQGGCRHDRSGNSIVCTRCHPRCSSAKKGDRKGSVDPVQPTGHPGELHDSPGQQLAQLQCRVFKMGQCAHVHRPLPDLPHLRWLSNNWLRQQQPIW